MDNGGLEERAGAFHDRLEEMKAEAFDQEGCESALQDADELVDEFERLIGHLRLGMEHRTVIGQAVGVVMERFGIGTDEAFAFLVRCSNSSQSKVHDVAAQIVETGEIPQS